MKPLSVVAALALFAPAVALAAPPIVPLQGNLTDAEGTPIDGTVSVTFSFYDLAAGGEPLWTEVQNVEVEDGFFTAYLGEVRRLSLELFRDTPELYLGIAVDTDPEMERVQIGTVPYAAFAEHCGNVPEHTHDGADVSGTLPPEVLPAGAVVGAQSCPSGQVVRGVDDAGLLVCSDTELVRSDQSCGDGEAVTGVDATGALTCAPSAGYTAGTGVAIAGGELSLATSYADGSAHDARFVNASGDTMTGALTVPGLDVVGAANADRFTWRTPEVRRTNIAGAAFVTADDTEDDLVARSNFGYAYIASGAPSHSAELMNAVQIPDGASITALSCRFYDSNATADLTGTAYLYRQPLTSTTSTTLESVSLGITGNANALVHEAMEALPSPVAVDNSTNHYFLRVVLTTGDAVGSTLRFYGCSVHWTATEAGP